MGKQKLRGAIFRCGARADFSRPLLWAEKAVNFLNREGQKRGATHGPPQERFTFVHCEAMSKVQKRYSLVKSNRNAPLNHDCRLLFLRLFLFDNSDAE